MGWSAESHLGVMRNKRKKKCDLCIDSKEVWGLVVVSDTSNITRQQHWSIWINFKALRLGLKMSSIYKPHHMCATCNRTKLVNDVILRLHYDHIPLKRSPCDFWSVDYDPAWINVVAIQTGILTSTQLNPGSPLRRKLERDDKVFVISGFEVLSTLIANVLLVELHSCIKLM